MGRVRRLKAKTVSSSAARPPCAAAPTRPKDGFCRTGRATLDESVLARADPALQRIVKRIAGGEGLFERRNADPLGALREQPARKLGHLVARAMQRDETVRIDVLAGRRDRAEALAGRLDQDMRWARQPRPALARFQRFLACRDAGEDIARGLPRVRPPWGGERRD